MNTLLDSPPLGPNTITTRPYQDDALAAARKELAGRRSTAVLLPTGTGKTVMFAQASRLCGWAAGR